MQSRKFFCENPSCSRRIFAERFEGLLARSQQKTSRLNQMLTCIREASIQEQRNIEKLRVVGINDWVYRRGNRYGTLVCDIENHQVIDVLPDRSVTTVSTWLKRHPEIQLVSRARASAYADAIRKGLPHAQQVADWWHLLKNPGDAVQRYLAR